MLLLPLLAGLLYALGAIFLKQVVDGGLGPWRMTVVYGWALGIAFAPLLLLPGVPLMEIPWLRVTISGALWFAGNLCLLFALSRGDVSVATPIMGSKVVMVALVSVVLFGESVPVRWWIAAFLSAAGITLLRAERGGTHRNMMATIFFATTSSLLFAVSDVLIQHWASPKLFNRYLPVTPLIGAVFTLVLWPKFREPLTAIPRSLWKPLLAGSVFMSGQAWLIFYTLSHYGHATAVNVMYSGRGLWAVALIWTVGRWLGNVEGRAGHRTMALRLAGAAILVVAVLLVTV
jgi:drug/metabolite transporter (DMT)-like permease